MAVFSAVTLLILWAIFPSPFRSHDRVDACAIRPQPSQGPSHNSSPARTDTIASKASDIFVFDSLTHWTVDLIPQRNGNLRTTRIPRETF
jgi:hypothetical protein